MSDIFTWLMARMPAVDNPSRSYLGLSCEFMYSIEAIEGIEGRNEGRRERRKGVKE